MKKMPQIPEVEQTIQMTNAFAGYNHKELIADGEMHDMVNLSGDLYPVLSTRKRRKIASYDVSGQASVPLTGIHGRDQLVFFRGADVYYNFVQVTGLSVSTATNMLPKKIVSMGAYVCIWPDKKYFNTVDGLDCGSMERLFDTDGDEIELTMCRGDGTDYDIVNIPKGANPPANPENNDFWLDQSGENDVLRQYSSATEEWVEVPSTYVKLTATGIGNGLNEYDSVTISGLELPEEENPGSDYVKLQKQVAALNGSFIVYAAGTNYVIIAGLLSNSVDEGELAEQTVHVDRTVPDLDYICESNNRLWGCKYGLENGVVVNEIRASKLGDFRNWQTFMGISTDSWTASIGTDGPWTGAITQRGYPVFFKEQAIHRVSGTMPGNFSIQTTMARGVQRGSWRSLAVVGENIYYKSRDGIMLYDGNMPISVSEAMGDALYSDARAGALREMYYISMKNESNKWDLFVYDTKKGSWWKQDHFKALGFGAEEDEIFAIDEEHNTLCSMTGNVRERTGDGILTTSWTTEPEGDWSATFGLYGTDLRQKKYMSRFDIRMFLEEGKYAQLFIQYDSSGVWEPKGEIRGRSLKSFVLPVIPKRCDHLQFMITGNGKMRIYAISRILEVGSDG